MHSIHTRDMAARVRVGEDLEMLFQILDDENSGQVNTNKCLELP